MASFELIEQLEAQLLEKEQLIAALTTSLEQAANELDRAHRHQFHDTLLAGKSEEESSDESNSEILREIREQQAMLFEIRDEIRYLNASPPQPQHASAASDTSLNHIEDQLEQIRELIESLAQSQPESAVLPADWKESLTQQMSKLRDNPIADLIGLSLDPPGNEQAAPKEATAEKPDDVEQKPVEAAEPHQTSKPDDLQKPEEKHSSESSRSESFAERAAKLAESLPEIPDSIDIETADEESLRMAVHERDECIQALQDYIVAMNSVPVPEFDLKDYDALPAAQREKLENWEAVLRENLRRTEVEISVERAKLAREQQKLQFEKLQFTKERKRLTMDQNAAPASPSRDQKKPSQRNPQSSRTWLSLFQRQETDSQPEQSDE